MKEARIKIGERELSFAQSLALRVAVGNMLLDLSDQAHRQALGKIAELYEARLLEIQDMLLTDIQDCGLNEPSHPARW